MAATPLRLRWYGDQVQASAGRGVRVGLAAAGEHLLGQARREVPIEEGTLERSGRAEVDAKGTTAAVSFDTPYARRQHEELTWRHDAGRKAKYLEDPLGREAPTMLALVAAAVRQALR